MSASPVSVLACSACGAQPPVADPYPFRCPRAAAGDDVDHLVRRRLDLRRVAVPAADERHPFLRYRGFLHSYHAARAGGMSDRAFRELVLALDRRVAEVDGRGFTVTPFTREVALSVRLGFVPRGGVWVKDETGNVAGSHKARHLMGVALWLGVMQRLGREPAPEAGAPPLAIASCGNAALAAAVLARAMGRALDVYVPTEAEPAVLERLGALGARIVVCPRDPERTGDPCVHGFRRAVEEGAIPFTCQGSENGLAIEGGGTLAYELAGELGPAGLALDRLFVQVGGGALASATIEALREMTALGVIERLPRFHPVQTEGCAPLARAHDRVLERVRRGTPAPEALRFAASHRSQFMWPWEETPRSVAGGILDDETYDWREVVAGMLETDGAPVVVSEERVREAHALARSATGILASHTGAAGLAGLAELRARGDVRPEERVGVLFTGVER